MKSRMITILLALSLLLGLLLLPGCLHTSDDPIGSTNLYKPPATPGVTDPVPPQNTQPSLPPETTEPTAPPETTVPPETTAPTGMYTTEELMALENEKKGYGPGISKDGTPPPYAKDCQTLYGQYGGNFYVPDSNSVYLTFDCGYEYSYKDENGNTVRVTEQILDVLKEKNVKGVFFVTMYYCKQSPDLVQRMVDEGHAVGNHTNNHKVLPNISLDDLEYEIMSMHDYVKEQFGYTMHLLRPPEGAFSSRSLAAAKNLGYKSVDWSIAHADWDPSKQPDTATAYKNMTERAHGGAIYLLHAVSVTNATILPDLIDYLQAHNYSIDLFE